MNHQVEPPRLRKDVVGTIVTFFGLLALAGACLLFIRMVSLLTTPDAQKLARPTVMTTEGGVTHTAYAQDLGMDVLLTPPPSAITTIGQFGGITAGNVVWVDPHTLGSIRRPNQPPVATGCGASPLITGGDHAFKLRTGRGAVGCTITFGRPWLSPPICVSWEHGAGPDYMMIEDCTTSTTSIACPTVHPDATYDVMCTESEPR